MSFDITGLLAIFLHYRANLGYGILSAAINSLAHWKHRDSARDSFVDILFCGALGWGVESLLEILHMPTDAAIIVACMIGYIGSVGLSEFIKDRLGMTVKTTPKKSKKVVTNKEDTKE